MAEDLPRCTTSPADPARRRFVAASLLAALGLLPAARAAELSEGAADLQAAAGWLLRMAGEPQATRALGRAYLATHPDEQDRDRLRTALLDALTATLGHTQPATLTPGEALAALRRLVRHDYLEAQVVMVDGWLLSRSEARLYALMALSAGAG
jgi:hypothetical protein